MYSRWEIYQKTWQINAASECCREASRVMVSVVNSCLVCIRSLAQQTWPLFNQGSFFETSLLLEVAGNNGAVKTASDYYCIIHVNLPVGF